MPITRTLPLAAFCLLATGLANAQAATTETLAGLWAVQSIDGEALPEGATMTIDFGDADEREGVMTMAFEMEGQPPFSESDPFTWTIDAEGIVTVNMESEDDPIVFSTAIEDGELTIVSQIEDEPGSMVLVRP